MPSPCLCDDVNTALPMILRLKTFVLEKAVTTIQHSSRSTSEKSLGLHADTFILVICDCSEQFLWPLAAEELFDVLMWIEE